jgi:hypothetical protein
VSASRRITELLEFLAQLGNFSESLKHSFSVFLAQLGIAEKSQQTEAFKIGEEAIERVDDFLYLGSKIDENGGTLLGIQQRINKARDAFSRLKNIWSASNINLQLKIKLFNACVKSVLLYGCETWFVTNNTTQKLQAFVNRCLRNILGIW